jgi:hypothetical protein
VYRSMHDRDKSKSPGYPTGRVVRAEASTGHTAPLKLHECVDEVT